MIRIDNRLPQFSKSARMVMNDALKEGAAEVLINARRRAPFEKGSLRRESDVKKNSNLNWRIRFWMEYARFQELGGDSRRRIRHYTTPGTGAHFLKNSGDKVAKKIGLIFKKHGGRAR